MKNTWIRRMAGNDYVFTIITKITVILIGLVTSSFSKRFLGPALEGELGYFNSIFTAVAVIANLGLYQPYPYHKRKQGVLVLDEFMNIFMMQFLVYTLAGVSLALVVKEPILIAVFLMTPIQVLANQLSFMIMVEDVKYKNVIFFTARVVNTIIIILAYFTMQPSLLVALAMILAGDLITVILTCKRLGKIGNPFKVNFEFLRSISVFGVIAMLTTLLLTLSYNVDEMMLKWMGIEDAQRGFYRTGASLASYGWLIPDSFREVLFSRTSKDDAIKDVSFSIKITFYITIVMLVAIMLFGKTVIRVLFGARYLPSFDVTVILLFGVLSMSFFKLIGTLLLAQGKKMVYMLMLAGSVIADIIANYFMIPRWGIEGAAISSVISYTVAGLLFLGYFVRTYQVPLADLFVIRKHEAAKLLSVFKKRKRTV